MLGQCAEGDWQFDDQWECLAECCQGGTTDAVEDTKWELRDQRELGHSSLEHREHCVLREHFQRGDTPKCPIQRSQC